jgi:hypothetical protein
VGCNEQVHRNSPRNLSVELSLPQTSKTICFSYYLLCFLFNKIGEQEGRTGSTQKQGGGLGSEVVVAQTVYTHVSKCKSDKIKGEKKKIHCSSLLWLFSSTRKKFRKSRKQATKATLRLTY